MPIQPRRPAFVSRFFGPASASQACRWFAAGLVALVSFQLAAAELSPASAADRIEKAYVAARLRFQAQTNDPVAAWEFGRACFDRADLAVKDAQREQRAVEGIEACRRAVALNSNCAPAWYYLGMNDGQVARTKLFGALKLLNEMETVWKKSFDLDAKFDFAGAHRSLGLLYRDAPGWPTSLGSRAKARVHLLKAVELSPEYPDNQLSLLESYVGWGERNLAVAQLAAAEPLVEAARKQLVGAAWELSWHEWDERLEKLREKLAPSKNASAHSRKGS